MHQDAPSDFHHEPVMSAEVVELFQAVPAGVVVDATLGGGGHAEALLRSRPDLVVVGIDRDRDALSASATRLAPFGARASVHHARFDDLRSVLAGAGWGPGLVSGVLFDLGVSSVQLDRPDRGFSYRADGPLDMRMDQTAGTTASDLVNGLSEDELTRLFAANGEGRLSRRIARHLVAARPLVTTGQLAEAVSRAIPAPARRRGHPARRVFQALRIAVNDELGALARALPEAVDMLAAGGRCVAISYHSGEDRLVKAAFAEAVTGGCHCPPGLPCVCGAVPLARLVTRGAMRPAPAEIERNHRAESARLRACERVPSATTGSAGGEGAARPDAPTGGGAR